MTVTRLLTLNETAERLGFCPGAIRHAIKSGDLPALKICGRYRIDVAELEQFLEDQRFKAA